MRVLILESVSGLRGRVNSRLLPEGFAMLRTMVTEFGDAGFDVFTVLNGKLKRFEGWLDAKVISNHDGLAEAIRLKPDAALVIAPESGGELERITAKLKKNLIKVLGPDEKAIRISSNKWLTYLALKGKVNQPKTWKTPPEFDGKLLTKPLNGVGCEGIRFFPSPASGRKIFQEFIYGEHVSCCLLMRGKDGSVLSVNKQRIKIHDQRLEYLGSEIPWGGKLAEKCSETALGAAEALGSRGFCGVDLVVGELPYFVELNPRVTTSFIALTKVLKANIAEILINTLVNGSSPPKPKLEGHSLVSIFKIKRGAKINTKNLNKLKDIPGIVAPPFAPDGVVEKGFPIFVGVGWGKSAGEARHKLHSGVDEACALLGVEKNAIAWS